MNKIKDLARRAYSGQAGGEGDDDYSEAAKEVHEAHKAMADIARGAEPLLDPARGAELRQGRLRTAPNTWRGAKSGLDELDRIRKSVADNTDCVSGALLSGFRLMRTTSSHMTNYSKCDPSRTRDGVNNTRMGLRLEAPRTRPGAVLGYDSQDREGTASITTGVGEYIIGGWCIGTVIDSAASRSTTHNLTNTAPASMAMNVHVNVEWWGAGKLHKHYMDNDVEARAGNKRAPKRERELVSRDPLRPVVSVAAEGEAEGEEY